MALAAVVLQGVSHAATSRSSDPGRVFRRGPFRIWASADETLAVACGSCRWAEYETNPIPCGPVYAANQGLLIVADGGGLKALDKRCHVVWKRELDYMYNPSSLCVAGGRVVEDEGPLTIGAREGYSSASAYWRELQRAWPTRGIDARTGKVVWQHGSGYSGLPLFSPDGHGVLCLTFTTTEGNVANEDSVRRLWLNLLDAKGRRIRRWVARFRSTDGAERFRTASDGYLSWRVKSGPSGWLATQGSGRHRVTLELHRGSIWMVVPGHRAVFRREPG